MKFFKDVRLLSLLVVVISLVSIGAVEDVATEIESTTTTEGSMKSEGSTTEDSINRDKRFIFFMKKKAGAGAGGAKLPGDPENPIPVVGVVRRPVAVPVPVEYPAPSYSPPAYAPPAYAPPAYAPPAYAPPAYAPPAYAPPAYAPPPSYAPPPYSPPAYSPPSPPYSPPAPPSYPAPPIYPAPPPSYP